jgi:hypothetical protein
VSLYDYLLMMTIIMSEIFDDSDSDIVDCNVDNVDIKCNLFIYLSTHPFYLSTIT